MKYNNGTLELGIHSMTAYEFVDFFCDKGNRKQYKKAIINIFDYAIKNGATRIIIGGSFITQIDNPNDLDCMIVFCDDLHIPTFIDCAQIDEIEYDILYSSEQTPKLIDSFIKLMSTDKTGIEDRGVVEVRLNDRVQPWKVIYQLNYDDIEIISRVYCERSIIERNKRRGILVVIHGINTRAKWLSNIIPSANSQGWIVAPFIYDNPKRLLFSRKGRQRVVEQFREWIYALCQKYKPNNMSVLCHSFGTYIITKYIDGFAGPQDYLPIQIDSLILTGSIIRPDYNWNQHIPRKIGRVLNIVAAGDCAVKYMPDSDMKKLMGMDVLFGKGAILGIKEKSEFVDNRDLAILTHTNIFKDDVIDKVFLPYLNANNGIAGRESSKIILDELHNKMNK